MLFSPRFLPLGNEIVTQYCSFDYNDAATLVNKKGRYFVIPQALLETSRDRKKAGILHHPKLEKFLPPPTAEPYHNR